MQGAFRFSKSIKRRNECLSYNERKQNQEDRTSREKIRLLNYNDFFYQVTTVEKHSPSRESGLFQVYNLISEMRHPYAHYEDIYPFIGHTTRSLCIVSVRNYKEIFGTQKFREDKCYVCPFSKIERCVDKTSTYTEIDRILWNSFNYGDQLSDIGYYINKHKIPGELITRFIDLLKQIR